MEQGDFEIYSDENDEVHIIRECDRSLLAYIIRLKKLRHPVPNYLHLIRSFRHTARGAFCVEKGLVAISSDDRLVVELRDLAIQLADDFKNEEREIGIEISTEFLSHFFCNKLNVVVDVAIFRKGLFVALHIDSPNPEVLTNAIREYVAKSPFRRKRWLSF